MPAFKKTPIGFRETATKVESFSGGFCAAPNCSARVPLDRIMCARHWDQVPDQLRARVIQQLKMASSGYPGAADSYRRACIKAVAIFEQPRRAAPTLPMREVLEIAQFCALCLLESGTQLADEAAWKCFHGLLHERKIAPSKLGVLQKKWSDGQLDAVDLRAEIEAFSL